MKQRPVGVRDSTGPVCVQWLDFKPRTSPVRRRSRLFFELAMLSAALSLTRCTNAPFDPPPIFDLPQPPPLSVSAYVSYEPSGDVHLTTLRSVSIAFTVVGAGASDLATLEFVGPGGSPYETRPVPLIGTPWDEQRLEFALPVGGTLVETAQMIGPWKAVLLINGRVAAAPSFDINP